jgi:hypothetical protein
MADVGGVSKWNVMASTPAVNWLVQGGPDIHDGPTGRPPPGDESAAGSRHGDEQHPGK